MAKAVSAKNTKNKALHSKLMKQKKNKLKSEKLTTQQKLKAIIKKSQE